jgi:hypothetical protein
MPDRKPGCIITSAVFSRMLSSVSQESLESQIPGHPAIEECLDRECMICSVRDCPHKEPLHYHHDGCPCCDAPHEPTDAFEDAEFLDLDTASDSPYGYPGA